jgi:hypothetical protein
MAARAGESICGEGGGMSSYHERLLDQAEPLEEHEIRALEEWLDTLRIDIEAFGPAAEDVGRMSRIRARIKRERGVK